MDKVTEKTIVDTTKNLKKFWKDKPPANPTSEQKKAWWERKRQAIKIMNEMILYQDMTLEQFEEHMKTKKGELKIWELITATRTKEILKDKKIMTYRIDKHVPNAPQQTEISWDIDNPIYIKDLSSMTLLELEELRSKYL